MTDTVSKFAEALKKRLKDNQKKFHQHYDMMGDTEGGFYEQDDFDFDAMLKEIDEFAAEFKAGNTSP